MAMPMPWPTGASGPASRIWPGKRARKDCEIQPLIVKLSITIVASGSITSQSSRAILAGWIGEVVLAHSRLFGDCSVKVGPHFGDFFEPVRPLAPLPDYVMPRIAKLTENEFRIADEGDLGRHVQADPRRSCVGLDVARGFVPRGRRAKLLAAPEPKADRQYRVGAPSERLLPRPPDSERAVLGHGALSGAPGVDRDVGEFNEFAQFGRGARPEDSVTRCDQGPLSGKQDSDRLLDALGVRSRTKFAGRIDFCAAALVALNSRLVENIRWNFDESDALRRARRVAKCLPQIDLDRRPVEELAW